VAVAVVASRWRAGWLLVALLAFAARTARANGAFPDGQTILLPADRPDEILMATNFGVLASEDAGASWVWSCEQPVNSYGRLYQLGPAPAHRLFAVAGGKLVFSDDNACGWQVAGGALAGQLCEDAFVDPNDGTHVLAAGLASGAAGAVYTVLESTDGGATFGRTLYTGAPGDLVTGLEIAASDPMTIDLALSRGPAAAPTLARSIDGGATWHLADLTTALGGGQVRIVAIDPLDDDRVWLRALGAHGDALALATRGGETVAVPLSFDSGALTAFVRTATGTLLAAGTVAGGPALFRSTDGGATFAALAAPPHILALAERAGTVYAATDTTYERFAEAISADEGATWQPGLAFTNVAAIAPCLKGICQTDCAARAQQKQWPAAVCVAEVLVSAATDGGTIDAGLSDALVVGPLTDAAVVVPIDAGDTPRIPPAGCSCAAAPGNGSAGEGLAPLAWLAALLLWSPLRRRRDS
jgi:MYXO-CTERM domain-containing protein